MKPPVLHVLPLVNGSFYSSFCTGDFRFKNKIMTRIQKKNIEQIIQNRYLKLFLSYNLSLYFFVTSSFRFL